MVTLSCLQCCSYLLRCRLQIPIEDNVDFFERVIIVVIPNVFLKFRNLHINVNQVQVNSKGFVTLSLVPVLLELKLKIMT